MFRVDESFCRVGFKQNFLVRIGLRPKNYSSIIIFKWINADTCVIQTRFFLYRPSNISLQKEKTNEMCFELQQYWFTEKFSKVSRWTWVSKAKRYEWIRREICNCITKRYRNCNVWGICETKLLFLKPVELDLWYALEKRGEKSNFTFCFCTFFLHNNKY